jgi:hypothetical protein
LDADERRFLGFPKWPEAKGKKYKKKEIDFKFSLLSGFICVNRRPNRLKGFEK